jgi:hypothetical protein
MEATMLWTAVGVLGLLCLVGAAFLMLGAPAALAVAGVALILSAIDGRR